MAASSNQIIREVEIPEDLRNATSSAASSPKKDWGHERELTVDGDGERSVQYHWGLARLPQCCRNFFNDQKENAIAIFGPVVVDGDQEFLCLPAGLDMHQDGGLGHFTMTAYPGLRTIFLAAP